MFRKSPRCTGPYWQRTVAHVAVMVCYRRPKAAPTPAANTLTPTYLYSDSYSRSAPSHIHRKAPATSAAGPAVVRGTNNRMRNSSALTSKPTLTGKRMRSPAGAAGRPSTWRAGRRWRHGPGRQSPGPCARAERLRRPHRTPRQQELVQAVQDEFEERGAQRAALLHATAR